MGAIDERRLISAVLRTGDMRAATHRGIIPGYFLVHSDEWEWVVERMAATKKVPTKADFSLQFPGFRFIRTDDVDLHAGAVVKAYAEQVLQGGILQVIDGLQEGKPLPTLLQEMAATGKAVAGALGAGTIAEGRLTDYKKFVSEIKRRQKAAARGGLGTPFGFETLDEATGGMCSDQVVVVCARPGVGKSWLLNRFAVEAVTRGKRVLFFSHEMNTFSVTSRMVSLLSYKEGLGSAFDPSAMRKGTLGRSAVLDLQRFLDRFLGHLKGEMHIVDSSKGRITPVTVQSCIEKVQPDIVFHDYLQLYARQNMGGGQDLRLEVARHSSQFKEWAGEYRMPYVTASQLNRTGDSKIVPPGLGAIAESDSPGQDADIILTAVPPSSKTMRSAIAKNREGPENDHLWIHKDPMQGIIEECTSEFAEELRTGEVMD